MELFYSKVTRHKIFFQYETISSLQLGKHNPKSCPIPGFASKESICFCRYFYIRCFLSLLRIQPTPISSSCSLSRGTGHTSLLSSGSWQLPCSWSAQRHSQLWVLYPCLHTDSRLCIPGLWTAKGQYILYSTGHDTNRDAAWVYLFQELPAQSPLAINNHHNVPCQEF